MLHFYYTVDTEIWLDGWKDIDARFAAGFRKYVYGPTAKGDYGLPFQLKVLNDHGLHGIFLVEPLFALRYGIDPLTEIVGLIREAGQSVELHLHPEWVDEAREPLLTHTPQKRPMLWQYSVDDQEIMIRKGMELLRAAGAGEISAFRAGSFGMNAQTFVALARVGLAVDFSFHPISLDPDTPKLPLRHQPFDAHGVHELPLTVFSTPAGLRPMQLGSNAFEEVEAVLDHALDHEWHSVVMLSHNSELMENREKTRPDAVVVRRFLRLARYLDRHRDVIATAPITRRTRHAPAADGALPQVGLYATGRRFVEQALRRFA